jgi:esterase
MKLFHKSLGDGPPLLILHGLFGSADNWQTLAKSFAQDFKVYLIDQRNHGHSPQSKEDSYALMADDLFELIAEEGLRDVKLIGHSMGGKTIMHFAQQYAFLIEKMIVADMGIKSYPPHHDDVFAGLFAVDVDRCESRQQAEERLSVHVHEPDTRQFLLKNLYWKEQRKLAWRFNLPVLFDCRSEFMKALPPTKIECDTLFLRGAKSHYILNEDMAAIRELVPHASFDTIENAGHWLHAQQPQVFLEKCLRFLKDV